jgi:hypothetical protein
MKTKKFKDFIDNTEISLDLDKNENNSQTINENKSAEELKKAAETIGLDLTKNLSKRIDVI